MTFPGSLLDPMRVWITAPVLARLIGPPCPRPERRSRRRPSRRRRRRPRRHGPPPRGRRAGRDGGRDRLERDAGQPPQRPTVPRRDRRAAGEEAVELVELRQAERALEIG